MKFSSYQGLQELLPDGHAVGLRSVEGRPHGLSFEQSHHFSVILANKRQKEIIVQSVTFLEK